MANKIQVSFSLQCLQRKDDEAGILVGYIPALRVYSQGRDEAELEQALKSAAELFLVICYEKGILGQALRDRGMKRATGLHNLGTVKEYVHVAEAERYDRSFTVNVPIELLAAKEAVGCAQL